MNQNRNEDNSEKVEKKHNYFYKITNLINDKYYYGIRSTDKNIADDLYFGSGKAVKLAIKKYGKDNFNKEIIADYPTRKEVNAHEKLIVTMELVLDEMCYNMKTGGDNEFKLVVSEETKQKIREKRKLQIITPEMRQKSADSRRGRKATQEHRQNISNALQGKYRGELAPAFGLVRSQETLQRMSASQMGNTNSPTRSCCINGIIYESVVAAAQNLNIDYSTIRYRLRNTKDKWSNWKYLNE